MKEKEFDRIVRELQNGKQELAQHGITFVLSGHNIRTGKVWYASNRKAEKLSEGQLEETRRIVKAGSLTLQPTPVHGKWIVDDEYINCSVCRRERWSRVPYENLVMRFRYCPNCGAKMEGEA